MSEPTPEQLAIIGKKVMDVLNEHHQRGVAFMGHMMDDRQAYEFLLTVHTPGVTGLGPALKDDRVVQVTVANIPADGEEKPRTLPSRFERLA